MIFFVQIQVSIDSGEQKKSDDIFCIVRLFGTLLYA